MGRRSESICVPWARMASVRAAFGRSGRRPCPVKVARTFSAAATGMRKRSVEPLSPQSRAQDAGTSAAGCTVQSVPFLSILASNACDAGADALLAVTPYLDAVEEDRLSRDNNIEISIRCAADLEVGTVTLPRSFPGCIVAIIVRSPPAGEGRVQSIPSGLRRCKRDQHE